MRTSSSLDRRDLVSQTASGGTGRFQEMRVMRGIRTVAGGNLQTLLKGTPAPKLMSAGSITCL
ncbi:MAG: hypothetical protein WC007_08265 [Pelobacteraceae bacterium]